MTRKVFATLLVVTVLCGVLPARPVHAACTLERIASVDVDLGPAGAVLVPVKINDHDVWMILQMSSGIALVSRAVAEQLGLELQDQRKLQINQGNGRFFPLMTIVRSMVVGDTNFAGWTLFVPPAAGPAAPMYKGRPVLGPLSSQFVIAADMELDLAHRKLNLFKQTSACRGRQVYWGGKVTEVPLYVDPAGLLVFPMEVDGKSVEASLNTQGRATLISEKVVTKFFAFTEGRQRGNDPADAHYRVMDLTAQGLAMQGVTIFLQDDLKSPCVPTTSDRLSKAIGFDECISHAPLSIGTDLLQRLHVYIAAKDGRIYFTRAEGPDSGAGDGPMAGGRGAPGAAAAGPAGDAAGGVPAAAPASAPVQPAR
jgi:hypothetical protein